MPEIKIIQTLAELSAIGPSVELDLSNVGDRGGSMRVLALIDTGCSHTCISLDVAERLALEDLGSSMMHQPGRPSVSTRWFRVVLYFSTFEIEMEVATTSTLVPPHDVLIGRNMLKDAKLEIDFSQGISQLRFTA